MTEENVGALRRAGCAEAWMGVESGSQAVLDAMDKGITIDEVRGAVGRLRGAGVRVGFFLQFGYPQEGWRDIEMTRQLVRELAPDEIGISVSYPLPGTRFHEKVRSLLGQKRNWRESDDLDPLFPGLFSRGFYRTLSRTVHAEFRTRRSVRALRAKATGLAKGLVSPTTAKMTWSEAVGGLVELPVWIAGQARLLPHIFGKNQGKQLP
jgi:anaerobic magnesium-protoporphyrin IX monomethyl ester cyclase